MKKVKRLYGSNLLLRNVNKPQDNSDKDLKYAYKLFESTVNY